MKIVAIIPAKGTSRRLPGKNIYPIWGKPMLYWAIKACKESKYNIEPWVSTEDNKIAEIAKKIGLLGTSAYVRVSELKKEAINKLIDNVDHSQVVDYL